MVLESISDHADRQYIEYLMDYLKKITLMYERGLLGKEAFKEQRTSVLAAIRVWSLHLEQKRGAAKSLEMGV
jgi:hypothetical protein